MLLLLLLWLLLLLPVLLLLLTTGVGVASLYLLVPTTISAVDSTSPKSPTSRASLVAVVLSLLIVSLVLVISLDGVLLISPILLLLLSLTPLVTGPALLLDALGALVHLPTDKLIVVLLALLLLLTTPWHPHTDLLGPAESLRIGGTAHSVGIHEASLAAGLAHAHHHATPVAVVSTDGDIHQGLLHGHHLVPSLALLLGLVGSLTRESTLRDISWSLQVHHLLLLRELHLHR